MHRAVHRKVDFTQGKLLKNIIVFALPMAFATILQLLFNAADVAIVGRFAGSTYQAAVGATSSVTHLIVNVFIGLAVGANVVMAMAFGEKDTEKQHRVTHTAVAMGLLLGGFVLLIGLFASEPLLKLIDTPEEILPYSVKYMKLYFSCAPAMLVYNYGAAVMRGVGETRKPLYYLLVAGVLNVIINYVTVVYFDMNVLGVALGTVVSQYVAAIWLCIDLMRAKGGEKLSLRRIRVYKKQLKPMLLIGLPSGVNTAIFSLSNLLFQSAVNGFGKLAIAGNTIAKDIEAFGEAFGNAIADTCVTAIGQNYGAKKKERIRPIIQLGVLLEIAVMAVFCSFLLFFGKYVARLFNDDAIVVGWTTQRIRWISAWLVITPFMTIYGAGLRGMGRSMVPMILNIFFVCVVRVLYLWLIYANIANQKIWQVYILYPVTWSLSGIAQTIAFYIIYRKEMRKKEQEKVVVSAVFEEVAVEAE